MRMMNNIAKYAPSVVNINIVKNYIPCSLNCSCVRSLNLKDSYTDRFIYKKCYSEKKKYTNSSTNDYLRRLIREKKM